MMKKYLVMCLMVLFAVTAVGCGGQADRQTKGPKEITVYTALEEDQIKAYLASFSKKHPDIKVNIVRDSTGIITAKLMAEKDNPKADVVWGLAATSLLALDSQKMLAPYSPKGVERILPEFRDSSSTPAWVGIDAWMTGVVVNTTEMKKKGVPLPEGFADLIKPEYKGLITRSNPASSGTGYLTVAGVLQMMGEEKGWQYLDSLHKNVAMYVHSGSKPAKMSASGEYPIGISFGYRGIQEKKKGAPVETVFPKEGSGWDLEANGLMKKNEIKDEAKLFLDWAISDEAMTEYNKSFAVIAIKNNNPVPEGFPKEPMKQMIKNDLKWAANNRDRILSEWETRYGSKNEKK